MQKTLDFLVAFFKFLCYHLCNRQMGICRNLAERSAEKSLAEMPNEVKKVKDESGLYFVINDFQSESECCWKLLINAMLTFPATKSQTMIGLEQRDQRSNTNSAEFSGFADHLWKLVFDPENQPAGQLNELADIFRLIAKLTVYVNRQGILYSSWRELVRFRIVESRVWPQTIPCFIYPTSWRNAFLRGITDCKGLAVSADSLQVLCEALGTNQPTLKITDIEQDVRNFIKNQAENFGIDLLLAEIDRARSNSASGHSVTDLIETLQQAVYNTLRLRLGQYFTTEILREIHRLFPEKPESDATIIALRNFQI